METVARPGPEDQPGATDSFNRHVYFCQSWLMKYRNGSSLSEMRGTPSQHATGAPDDRRPEDDAIWARYRDNTARHVMSVDRHIQLRIMGHLVDTRHFVGLRPSLGPLLGLVAAGRRSPRDLAERLSISAQACGQLIDVAEDGGYLTRRPDPHDGRGRRIELTTRGRRLTTEGVRILGQIEGEERARIGAARFDAFADAVAALHGAWTAAAPAAFGHTTSALAPLQLLSVEAQRRLMEASSARGHAGLKMSHAQVLPLIGVRGARIGVLARVQGISRQAVSATARDLERLGYVERVRIEGDKRGVALQLTASGQALIRDSVHALDALDADIQTAIGKRRAGAFAKGARALYGALDLEHEIFDDADATRPESVETIAARLHRNLGRADRERLATLLAAPAAADI